MPELRPDYSRCLVNLYRVLIFPVAFVLWVYNSRRILFSLAVLFIPRKPPRVRAGFTLPDLLILAPCRNEETMVAGLARALEGLDYPPGKLQVVWIDDGSEDRTRAQMQLVSQGKPGWHVLSLPGNRGKASALNAALARNPFGEIVLVYDADHRPLPEAPRRAAAYFSDGRVAGISGRTLPVNPLASPSAYYAAVEGSIHQMVTMRAKDRLNLAPALLGSNCAYRRSALDQVGGFRSGALLEDSDLTVAFYRAGYIIRFAEDAIATYQVPETVGGYVRQHTRWSRGFNDVSRSYSLALLKDRKLALPLRLELILFAAGYLDRLALAGAAIVTGLSSLGGQRFPFLRATLAIALLTPLAQMMVLFAEQRAERAMWVRLPLVPLFFLIDIYSAARGMLDAVMNRKRSWARTERVAGS